MIRQAQRAPAQAADEVGSLFAAEYPGMVGMATLLLGDRAAAEDVVQDAFARVLARWEDVRDGASPGGYLRAAVVNGVRSRARRAKVADRAEARGVVSSTAAAAASGPGGTALGGAAVGGGPEERLLASDEQARVVRALDGLPDRQRECAVLRYYLEFSEPEIAEALGLAVGSVKSHLHRARQSLAAALEER